MEEEIKHISGAAGGYLVGRSHADNGIKAINKATGKPLEMEGGEVVITKPAVEDSELREFEGEMLTNREILSRINVSGGGVSFEKGGDIPTELYFDEKEYNYNGEKLPGHTIAYKISSCGCNHGDKKYTKEEIDHLISQIENQTRIFVENNDIEKLEKANKLIGDLIDKRNLISEGKTIEDIASMHNVSVDEIENQLMKGIEVESEHSDNFETKMQIAMDHLVENPKYYDILEDAKLEKGGMLTDSEKESLYKEWNELVNMSASSLKSYYDSEDGEDSGLSEAEAKEQGIKSGRESARWIMKMKETNVSNWTPEMWEWAKRQISFIKRMKGIEGKLYDENENKTRKHKALLIWGHNPEIYEKGGKTKDSDDNLDNMAQAADDVLDGPDIVASEGGYFEKGGFLPTDISEKLRADIVFLVDLQDKKQNNRPSDGWDINLFKSSFFNKVKKLPTDQANVVLDFLTALEETVGVKPIFSKNHKIWENYKSSDDNQKDEYNYMLLSRLKTDNDYFLGNGNRNPKHLWANNVKDQISEMKTLWNNLKIKPEWLSMEDILNYEIKMTDSNKETIKSVRKYKDSTIQDRYNFETKKQEYGYLVEFNSGKQWIGYAENPSEAKDKALSELGIKRQPKYKVGDFVKYETGDLDIERWVGEIKEVKDFETEFAYRIDAYTRGVEPSPMFDSASVNEIYEVELKPSNDLVFNEAKKHYNRVMEKRQSEKHKTYDLGSSFAGGVTVVWDRNQQKNGDYKTIAHVFSNGEIKYFEENLPQYVIDYVEGVRNNSPQVEKTTTETHYSISNYRNPYEVNRAIEKLIDSKESGFTPNEIEFISNYSGYGGLEKQGTFSDEELKGLLYEYFTPDAIVKKMWALAYKYGFGTIENPHVMEPSVGTGNFFKYAPTNAELFGNEINRFSKKVSEILYPKAMITLQPFEKNFISKNNSIKNKLSDVHKYHLVIGNPPYGRADSKFLAMGEKDYTKASNFTEYFITRGLDLLHPSGLLIFVVGAEQYNGGTLFLDSGISSVKKNIFDKAQLLDAYRLPTKIFERTGVASEILVFKKK